MNVENVTKLTVLQKIANAGIKDPSKTYYKLLVMQDEDAGVINCTQEVHDAVEVGKTFPFVTLYSEKYGSFRITDIVKSTAGKEVNKQ